MPWFNIPEILLGTDHPLTWSLLARRNPKVYNSTPCKVRAITRAQRKTWERERVDNIAADAGDGAVSKQLSLQHPLAALQQGRVMV